MRPQPASETMARQPPATEKLPEKVPEKLAEPVAQTITTGLGWWGAALRIEFVFPEERRMMQGTGFIVQDAARNSYLMTCAHLAGHDAWENRISLRMRTFRGDRVFESLGSSLHVGTSIDVKHPRPNGRVDMTTDLVIRPVAGDWFRPMELAAEDPKVGDWVWAVGQEAGRPPGDEQLFLAKIVEVADGGYAAQKQDTFDPHGFSGGPIVNASGEVVGNVLAGGAKSINGATVTTLRRRLAESGVILAPAR
jgi:S1-C subfamily serine protease